MSAPIFSKGQKVLLNIPKEANPGSRELRNFNNCVHTISRVHFVPVKHSVTLELRNVISKAGVPFTIAKEWVIPIKEAE
jgi:hypothetical protein